MTSEATATRSSSTRTRANGGDSSGPADAVHFAVREMRSAIDGVGRSVPEVAKASRSSVDALIRAVETGSDQQVTAGVSLSLGLAIGMLVGGAPRLLILMALAPLAVVGLAVADRRTGRNRSAGSAS
jgi:hypothetical protein